MIIVTKPQAAWRSTERLYLNSNGAVVKHGDPDVQILLVAAGGEIPLDQAKALGLVDGEDPILDAEPDDYADGLQEELDAAVTRAQSAESSLADESAAKTKAEADLAGALAAQKRTEGDLGKAKADLKATTTERDGLKGQIATLTTERDALKTQLAAASAELEALKARPQDGG